MIENRIAVYLEETAPVIDFYQDQDKQVTINGMGEVDEVTHRLFATIDELI